MSMTPPSVPDLQAAPELAALHLLVEAIDTAELALLAEHPDLFDCEYPRDGPPPPVTALAEAIIRFGAVIDEAAAAYRVVVLTAATSPRSPDDNRDF